MNIDFFRNEITRLRKVLEPDKLTDTRANKIWLEFRKLDQIKFSIVVDQMINESVLNIDAEGFEDKLREKLFEDESPSEEVKELYIKPVFKIPHDNPVVKSNYCCFSGFVFARQVDTKHLYVFKCSCSFGNNRQSNYPTWVNNVGYVKE